VNFNDYKTKHFSTYEAFAKTVCSILYKALQAAENLPRPQLIKYRAKRPESLRHRLDEEGNLDTEKLEFDRRDLAGARIIFYTNNDVERFLRSPLISENFKIDKDSTRIHHPTPENKGERYRAIHYTVQLTEDRTRLPEYARFADLRCEIQVQTILNHAWSETSHDILYKDKLGDDYGRKAKKGIKHRLERIMDEYLSPAGYEIQIAKQEYERILQGKELFDKNIANLLDHAQNNNERCQILSGLKDYVIPNCDDLPAAYKELNGPLLRAVKAARATKPAPIEATYRNTEDFKAYKVKTLVIEIIKSLRYVDVIETLKLVIDIYLDEPNDGIRQQIRNAVKNLAEYNISVYNKIGLMPQMVLVDHLAGMTHAKVDSIRSIALTVWTEAIRSNITGAKWKADSVVLSTGSIPVSDQLREIRDKAIKALFSAYDRSTDEAQKRAVLSALDAATRSTPNASNQLLATMLKDATRIVDFVTQRAKATSYELLQHLEHRFLYDYFRAKSLTKDPENRFGCQAEAEALVAAIFQFRDTINADDRFVRYKVLVGFESVYPNHWTDKEFDYKRADEFRRGEAALYIDEINAASENDWFDLIARCAETKSNDLATFPPFGDFICRLAERKPEVADRLLAKASDDLRNFLSGFLNGLAKSARRDIYELILERELESARNLAGVAHHLHYSDVKNPDFAAGLLKRAIDKGDARAVIELLLFALEQYGTEKITDADTLLRDSLTFLNDRKDASWASRACFLKETTKFEELTPERTAQVLQNLGYLREVDYQVERVLVSLAKRQPEAVWDYFGARLAREAADGEDEERFEAVPFQFHDLDKELSKDPKLAISKGLSWFEQDRKLFRLLVGALLSATFPNCPPEFAVALTELVKAGGNTEADFALEILNNYDGEPSTHVVLKEIVSRFPDDSSKIGLVKASIDKTGVVSGEFGFAEALKAKKESMIEWLADHRPEVKVFAKNHIAELNLGIQSEWRRVETEKEMRNRSYDEDESDDGDGNEGEAVGKHQ